MLPHKELFPEAGGYYQSALHELGHWTGHASRLDRATLQEGIVEGPYSKQYAREELRAEISSMMTGERLQTGHDPGRCAAYVAHWIQALRDDSREIYRASRDAQAISDYVLRRERERDQPRQVEKPVVAAPASRTPGPPQPVAASPSGEQLRLFGQRRPPADLVARARSSLRQGRGGLTR